MRTPGTGLGPTWITHGGPRSLHVKTLHHTSGHLFPNKIRSTGSGDLASHPPSLQPSKSDTSFHLLPHGQELGTSSPAGSLGPQAGQCSRPSATVLHHEALDSSSKVFTNLEDTRESSKTHDTEEEGKKRPRFPWTLPPPPGRPSPQTWSQGPVHLTFRGGGVRLEVTVVPGARSASLAFSMLAAALNKQHGAEWGVRSNKALCHSHLGDKRNVM